VAVAGKQPNALAVALNDKAIAVVLDFVDANRMSATTIET
jgi:hypothetical protein